MEADGSITLKIVGTEPAPKPLPIRILLGLPARILQSVYSLRLPVGVQDLHFFESERSEPSYAQSSLWTSRSGKTASFSELSNPSVRMFEVGMHTDLQSAISFLQGEGAHIALDNYEAQVLCHAILVGSATSASLH